MAQATDIGRAAASGRQAVDGWRRAGGGQDHRNTHRNKNIGYEKQLIINN